MVAEGHQTPSPTGGEEDYTDESQIRSYKDDSQYARSPPSQQQHFQPTSPIDRWNVDSNVSIDAYYFRSQIAQGGWREGEKITQEK